MVIDICTPNNNKVMSLSLIEYNSAKIAWFSLFRNTTDLVRDLLSDAANDHYEAGIVINIVGSSFAHAMFQSGSKCRRNMATIIFLLITMSYLNMNIC